MLVSSLFEMKSHILQDGLQLTLQWELILSFWSSYLCLISTGIIGTARFKQCWWLNPWLCASQASTQLTEALPQVCFSFFFVLHSHYTRPSHHKHLLVFVGGKEGKEEKARKMKERQQLWKEKGGRRLLSVASNFWRRQEDIIPASQRRPGKLNTHASNAIPEGSFQTYNT